MQIEGLSSIEADTVLAYLGFAKGEPVSAAELNDRPRKRLAFKKPIELIGDLLLR